jgi:hypothetical protein
MTCRIGKEGLAAIRVVVLPVAERERRIDAIGNRIAHSHAFVPLLRALHHLRTDDHARLSGRADVGRGFCHRHRWAELRVERAVRARILQRLAVVLQPVERQRVPESPDPVREMRRLVIAAEGLRKTIRVVVVLREELRIERRFEPLGLARRDLHGRADRVARIERGKRPV